MSTNLYTWFPLRGPNDVQLLRVEEDLSCFLSVVSLENKPLYDALSYTWGPPFEGEVLEDRTVSIDGEVGIITGNLHAALQQFKPSRYSADQFTFKLERRLLWVDAICIDQLNDYEKTEQVRLMPKIYSTAFCTIVWLGEDSPRKDGEFVTRILNDKTKVFNENPQASEKQFLADKVDGRYRNDQISIFQSRRYFRRRWILQEICMSHNIILSCGKFEAKWQDLRDHASQNCFGQARDPENSIARLFDCGFMTPDRRWRPDANKAIADLCKSSDFACSDPRDIIYSLRDLCGWDDFPVDYSQPWPVVFTSFASHIVSKHPVVRLRSDGRRLEASVFNILVLIASLQATQREFSSLFDTEIPSWAPDWRISAPSVLSTRFHGVVKYRDLQGNLLMASVDVYGTIEETKGISMGRSKLSLVATNGTTSPDLGVPNPEQQTLVQLRQNDILCTPLVEFDEEDSAEFKAHPRTPMLFATVGRPMSKESKYFRIMGICPTMRFGLGRCILSGGRPTFMPIPLQQKGLVFV